MQINNKRQTRGIPEHIAKNISFRFMANEPVNIFECGTGKGVLTYYLTKSLYKGSKLYTFEINKEVSNNTKQTHEIFSDCSKVEFGVLDVIKDAPPSNLINKIDFMVLDMPSVPLCIHNIKDLLKPGSLLAIYILNFSILDKLKEVLTKTDFEIEDIVSTRKLNIKLRENKDQLIPYQTLPDDNFEPLVLYCRKMY